MSCGVYQIKNKENGLIYIGSSRNIKKRWSSHKYELRKNKHCNMFLQNDWNIYGEDKFEFTILEECTEDDQYNLEQEYINNYLPFHRNDKGYNINESSKRGNIDNIRIFKRSYRKINEFYGQSKEGVKRSLNEMIKNNDIVPFGTIEDMVNSINVDSKYIWSEIEGNMYWVHPTFGKNRFVDCDKVNNMTRDELDSYCDALDTYEDFLEMAREGYIGDWD